MKCHLFTPVLMCALLASCSSTGGNKGLFGAAAGALIGSLVGDNLLSNDNNSNGNNAGGGGGAGGNNSGNGGLLEDNAGLITGGIAGYAAGAISDSMAKEEVRQKYLDGYNKGRSDAIKELYWVKRDAERPSSEANVQRRYYEVPVPEHITTDGVLVSPHKAVIEVVE